MLILMKTCTSEYWLSASSKWASKNSWPSALEIPALRNHCHTCVTRSLEGRGKPLQQRPGESVCSSRPMSKLPSGRLPSRHGASSFSAACDHLGIRREGHGEAQTAGLVSVWHRIWHFWVKQAFNTLLCLSVQSTSREGGGWWIMKSALGLLQKARPGQCHLLLSR